MSANDRPRYAQEEVFSTVTYPDTHEILPVAEQVSRLRGLFPELGPADEIVVARALPDGAEGWLALPRWECLAPSYGEAVTRVVAALERTRPFRNRLSGELGEGLPRQTDRTTKMLAELLQRQKRDVLLVPAQLGLRHRGRSARRAIEMLAPGEFGLGALHVAAALLTHPERLTEGHQLRIDCLGDTYGIDEVPLFSFANGRLEFCANYRGDASSFFGAATGFVGWIGELVTRS
jgi:hypothetical protein